MLIKCDKCHELIQDNEAGEAHVIPCQERWCAENGFKPWFVIPFYVIQRLRFEHHEREALEARQAKSAHLMDTKKAATAARQEAEQLERQAEQARRAQGKLEALQAKAPALQLTLF